MKKKYRKKTDNQILKAINMHHAVTETELAKILGYASMGRRLRTMIKKGKLQYLTVGNNTSCKYKLFTDYAGIKIYYTNKDNLRAWVKAHLPDTPSSSEKQAITMRVRRNFKIEV